MKLETMKKFNLATINANWAKIEAFLVKANALF